MTFAAVVPLPFLAKCSYCLRVWLQTEAWPEGTVLECECGALAEVEALVQPWIPTRCPMAGCDGSVLETTTAVDLPKRTGVCGTCEMRIETGGQ